MPGKELERKMRSRLSHAIEFQLVPTVSPPDVIIM